jgi:hypothetical protein
VHGETGKVGFVAVIAKSDNEGSNRKVVVVMYCQRNGE